MGRSRALLAVVLSGALLIGGPAIKAFADVTNATGTNVQDGSNNGNTRQGGKSASGDAVGGQVTGVVAGGRTSVDARNVSSNSSVESGDAEGTNTSNSVVGLVHTDDGDVLVGTTDLSFVNLNDHGNLQDGNNRQTLSQTANASTGDGVAGEVIGVVTAAGGSASVVAANNSNNVDVTSGDAHADNASAGFVGLVNLAGTGDFQVGSSDISNVTTLGSDNNLQDGNNRQTLNQSAASTTGDGVAGQVIGVVAAGATSVDANNTSDNVSVDTGDAHSTNSSGAAVGLAFTEDDEVEINPADITNVDASDHLNAQDGNNAQTARQTASSTTGDGVAGEVIGAVTAAGGSASIVAANTSRDSDVTTGDADTTNDSAAFVGNVTNNDEIEVGTGDIDNVSASSVSNIQDGNNRQTLSQSSRAATGDGVAGQVIGAVSAGATSIDARNLSDGVDVETGDAASSNNSSSFVGLASSRDDDIEIGGTQDISNVSIDAESNIQDGNNRQTLNQSASASSGDGVAGEVIGAVTAAGGSASIVAANSSKDSGVTTGDADSTNDSTSFVGLAMSEDGGVFLEDVSNLTLGGEANVQDGNNSQSANQSATSATGDGVAGQVIGAVSAGATSIDARNSSDGIDIDTGDASADNDSITFVGLAFGDDDNVSLEADVENVVVDDEVNLQDGSNRQTLSQRANSVTGDGVGGEIIGAVTSAGGSASIVAANTSTNSDVTTGDADSANDSAAFVGIAESESDDVRVIAGDVDGIDADGEVGVQDGNNRQSLSQSASSSTGDGVAGQVIGAVSAGRTSIDASNTSDNMSVESGDADASNRSDAFVGIAFADEDVEIGVTTDVTNIAVPDDGNVQDGNNSQRLSQTATATTGDGVGGEVIGVVTSAGGSASVVAANRSTNSDATTGDATSSNNSEAFVGLAWGDSEVEVAAGDVSNVSFTGDANVQDGSNRQSVSQAATATTGDGVAGQVIGVVSAGATSVDAQNTTDDSSVESGDADASNSTANFVGLAIGDTEAIEIGPADITNATATNIQDGSNRQSLSQSAAATSGDAVAGQVLAGVTAGVITGAGGQVSVVVANTSSGIDATSGDAAFDNASAAFIGLGFTVGPTSVAALS